MLSEKQKKPFVLLNDEVTEAWYLPLVLFLIQLHNFPSVASLAQSSKVQNGPDSSLFCRPARFEVGRFFFSVYFSTSFKNQNIYLKKP